MACPYPACVKESIQDKRGNAPKYALVYKYIKSVHCLPWVNCLMHARLDLMIMNMFHFTPSPLKSIAGSKLDSSRKLIQFFFQDLQEDSYFSGNSAGDFQVNLGKSKQQRFLGNFGCKSRKSCISNMNCESLD